MKHFLLKITTPLVLTLLLLSALLLTACNGNNSGEQPTDTSIEVSDTTITLDETTAEYNETDENTEEDTTESDSAEETTEAEQDTTPVIEPTVFDYEGNAVKSLTIAGQPIEKFTVIYPAGADSMPEDRDDEAYDATVVADKTAALDMAKYLSMATGKTVEAKPDTESFEYEIAIGHTSRDTDTVRSMREGLEGDGYLLLCENGQLFITGDRDRGTPNGVYSFLDEYIGVRFFTQTLEKVLPADEIAIPADLKVTYMPQILFRSTSWITANLNTKEATETLNANSFGAKSKMNTRNDDRNLVGCGGGIRPTLADHNFGSLSETGDGLSKQPCLTDEAIFNKIYKAVKKKLKSNPDTKVVVVSQNDSDSFCTCANCRAIYQAENYSGLLITFINKLSDALAEDYPNVSIRTLAYGRTLEPPKTIKPNDNVIVMVANIDACDSHAIGDESCYRAIKYAEYLSGWAAITKRLAVWDYTTNFQYYLSPFPNFESMRANMAIYVANKVDGIYVQGNNHSASGEFGELRTYLIGKLMWEPTMSKERYYSYMDEFLQAYYGQGWRYIREYIDKMAERTKLSVLEANSDPRGAWAPDKLEDGTTDMSFLEEMKGLWEEAAVHSSEEYQAHIEQSSIQVLFSDIWLSSKANTDKSKNSKLISLCRKYEITKFNAGLDMNATSLQMRIPKDQNY